MHTIKIEIPSDGSCVKCPLFYWNSQRWSYVCGRFKKNIVGSEPLKQCDNKVEMK